MKYQNQDLISVIMMRFVNNMCEIIKRHKIQRIIVDI